MKKCPFCAEEIQDEAIKCRYCKEWLEGSMQGVGSLPKEENDELVEATQKVSDEDAPFLFHAFGKYLKVPESCKKDRQGCVTVAKMLAKTEPEALKALLSVYGLREYKQGDFGDSE